MAEYINKEQLDRKFIIKMLSPTTSTIFDVKEVIDELQPANVIERSKIDKAIEEIKHLTTYHKTTQGSELVSRKAVLRTINKYLGE